MRYTGGLLGGSWLTALMGDLGNGKFDGAWLVTQFREPQPSQHALDEALQPLFQDRQRGTALSRVRAVVGRPCPAQRRGNAVHRRRAVRRQQARGGGDRVIRWLARRPAQHPLARSSSSARRRTTSRRRNRRLDWILDLYESVDDIRAHGQTIVYAVHESIGHLGIFVSGSVAKKEHDEFASNIDLIDVLPPGLYEAVMTPKDPSDRVRRLDRRRLSRALRSAERSTTSARWAATTKRTTGNLRRLRVCPRSISASIARSFSRGCGSGPTKALPNGCAGSIRCACSTRCFRLPIRSCGRYCHPSKMRENRQPVSKDNTFWQAQEPTGKAIE